MLKEVRKGISVAKKSFKAAKTPAKKAVIKAGISAMKKYYNARCKKAGVKPCKI